MVAPADRPVRPASGRSRARPTGWSRRGIRRRVPDVPSVGSPYASSWPRIRAGAEFSAAASCRVWAAASGSSTATRRRSPVSVGASVRSRASRRGDGGPGRPLRAEDTEEQAVALLGPPRRPPQHILVDVGRLVEVDDDQRIHDGRVRAENLAVSRARGELLDGYHSRIRHRSDRPGLGAVVWIIPASRALARASAALSSVVDAPRRRPPPPCSCTHQTPLGPGQEAPRPQAGLIQTTAPSILAMVTLGSDTAADPVRDWARSGAVWLTGHGTGSPLVPVGDAASSAARMAEHIERAAGGAGRPVRVDGGRLLAERAAFTGGRRRGRSRSAGVAGCSRTADGWAAVSCARPDDPLLLGALIEAEISGDPWPPRLPAGRRHTGAELAERAELLGVAAARVSVPGRHSDPPCRARPARWRACSSSTSARCGRGRCAPTCSAWPGRAWSRSRRPPAPTAPAAVTAGSTICCTAGTARSSSTRARRRPPAMAGARRRRRRRHRGLPAARPRRLRPRRPRGRGSGATWVSITAAGRASERVGFGDDVAAGAGLVAADAGGSPMFCGDAIADPLTGLFAAALVLSTPPGNACSTSR